MDNNYRKIGILTDAHGLLEPTEAALKDMTSKGITEIYSLGDNIGIGPNPGEVMDILEEYGVQSIAGNSEDYVTLGLAPFNYVIYSKAYSHLWTMSKLNEQQIGTIRLYPHSLDLFLGGKKIALCHFANDVRIDYDYHSTLTYQRSLETGASAYKQFLYTNSEEQKAFIDRMIMAYGTDDEMMKGYLSALKEPLFKGKQVDFYDMVFQGHVHWKLYETGDKTEFYTLRAVGMGYKNDPVDTASYVILEETSEGLKVSENLVKYDREKMVYAILRSDEPSGLIRKYACVDDNGFGSRTLRRL